MPQTQTAKSPKEKQVRKHRYVRKFYSESKTPKPNQTWDEKEKAYYDWGYDIPPKGKHKRARVHGYKTQTEAINAVSKILTDKLNGKVGIGERQEPVELIELVERRLPTIKDKKEQTKARRVLSTFLEILEDKIFVEEITTSDFQKYIELREKAIKPQSIDRELNCIIATLNAAELFFPSLAQWKMPKVVRPSYSKEGRERPIKKEERKKLLEHLLRPKTNLETNEEAIARRRIGLILQTALLTGARPGEVFRIKKSDIDFEAKVLKIVARKVEKKINPVRRMVFGPTLEAIFRERIKETKTEYLFTRSGIVPPNYYEIIKKACSDLNIPYGKDTPNGIVPYDTRHTFTTEMIMTNDIATVRKVLGHSKEIMTLHYSHTTDDRMELAAINAESIAGEKLFHPDKKSLDESDIKILCALVVEDKLLTSDLVEILTGKTAISGDLQGTIDRIKTKKKAVKK